MDIRLFEYLNSLVRKKAVIYMCVYTYTELLYTHRFTYIYIYKYKYMYLWDNITCELNPSMQASCSPFMELTYDHAYQGDGRGLKVHDGPDLCTKF